MSLKKEAREEIKRYILRHIQSFDPKVTSKTVAAYGISRTTVNNYIRQLLQDGVILADDSSASKYKLADTGSLFSYSLSEHPTEDRIFNRDIRPFLSEMPHNVIEIWQYSFTEMMNNAIEHAEATEISVFVSKNALSTTILIADNGVGIFEKIRAYISETEHIDITLDEAVSVLYAGKFTTDRAHHSGEGIFFSSRATDLFSIYSKGKVFTHNVLPDAVFDSPLPDSDEGTIVIMRLENESRRDLLEVMNMFSDVERGFFRTQLPLAHIFSDTKMVSRSEARRLVPMISRFEDVTLDFAGITGIGQAFTHELFIVFQREHPEIRFTYINACSAVESMILRVQNTK